MFVQRLPFGNQSMKDLSPLAYFFSKVGFQRNPAAYVGL
jgi:predicted lactoylglutathione lyase